MNTKDIETRWQQLDPIFILGRQRTGTSIMWRALRVAGFLGFPEGHLWYDLIKPFAWWRDPQYKAYLREEIFTLGSGRNLLLEKEMALLIDRFHRNLLPPETVRWVSKSPGVEAVLVAPMLAEMFPRAQFLFMKRNAITTVHSTIKYVSRRRNGKIDAEAVCRYTCENWVRVMERWRQVRPLLAGRSLEVSQEDIVSQPDEVAHRVMTFLGAPQWTEAVAGVFKSTRENTAFPDKPVGDFFYAVDWTDEQKQMLADICGDEMAMWGYPLDFQYPGGPDPAKAVPVEEAPLDGRKTYYRWIQEQELHEQELQMYKELLARIEQGRVMRVLNWLNRQMKRFRR
ncbi:MAG: sulfotransferase [Caldilineae bacterium]|nr:MAG: sulfotransferase [Caldilineae bacterium]